MQYVYLISRVRGTNSYPKQIKSSTNPGGIGHSWVKERFVDPAAPGTPFMGRCGTDRIFIPSRLSDNSFLMRQDPEYKTRLENLPDREKRALLYGDWDIFEGQFFTEFDIARHVCADDAIPRASHSVVAFDYGFDMLAAYICICDSDGRIYVTDEFCAPNLTLGEAAIRIAELCRGKNVEFAVASPDLWNRRQDTGKSGFEIMQETSGMPPMRPADDRRIPGWRLMREHLKDREDGLPGLIISRRCRELIRCMPALLFDKNRTEDASGEPHSVTHSPEALRYALMSRFATPEATEHKFRFKKNHSNSFFD
jgi:phage terminase large subunit